MLSAICFIKACMWVFYLPVYSSICLSIFLSIYLSTTHSYCCHLSFYTLASFRSIQGKLSYSESISCSTWARCSIKIPFLDIPKNIIVLC